MVICDGQDLVCGIVYVAMKTVVPEQPSAEATESHMIVLRSTKTEYMAHPQFDSWTYLNNSTAHNSITGICDASP